MDRLVIKGYSECYGIDYIETFSTVAKLEVIRAVLSVVVKEKCIYHNPNHLRHFRIENWKKQST